MLFEYWEEMRYIQSSLRRIPFLRINEKSVVWGLPVVIISPGPPWHWEGVAYGKKLPGREFPELCLNLALGLLPRSLFLPPPWPSGSPSGSRMVSLPVVEPG